MIFKTYLRCKFRKTYSNIIKTIFRRTFFNYTFNFNSVDPSSSSTAASKPDPSSWGSTRDINNNKETVHVIGSDPPFKDKWYPGPSH